MIATSKAPAVLRATGHGLTKHRMAMARPISVCVRAFQGDGVPPANQQESAVAPPSSQQHVAAQPARPLMVQRSVMRLPSLMRDMERELDSMTRMMGLPSLGMGFWGDDDDLFGAPSRMLRDIAPALPTLPTMRLATDITETDSAFVIKADAPGMAKKDIKVTIHDGILTISGERREEHTFGGEEPAAASAAHQEEQGKEDAAAAATEAQPDTGKKEKEEHEVASKRPTAPLRYERSYGSFRRSFSLPPNVDAEGITASAQDGVLTITLPKVPEAVPLPKEVPVA